MTENEIFRIVIPVIPLRNGKIESAGPLVRFVWRWENKKTVHEAIFSNNEDLTETKLRETLESEKERIQRKYPDEIF